LLLAKKLTWKDGGRDVISKVNPVLTEIIDKIDPSTEHLLVKVSYPFGSEILKNGILHLPNDNEGFTSFSDSSFDPDLKELFAYNLGANPVAVLLKNTAELFLDLGDRIIPFSIISPGKIFGTWKVLDDKISHCPATFVWGLTAGARSVFMLQKISETGGYNRLKNRLDINTDKARNLLDHWRVFKEIAHSDFFGNPWEVEVAFFSGNWFTHKHDSAWNEFNYYLMQTAWDGSCYWRNQFIWGIIFSTIQKELAKLNIKPSIYMFSLVKQLLLVGTGAVLGFQPAIDDFLAPIRKLQEIFTDIYDLKHCAPIIMQPANFKLHNSRCRPVYYSLQHLSSIEFAAKSNEKTSTLEDLYYLRRYLRKCINEIVQDKFNIETTPLYEVVRTVEYNFYHNNAGRYKEIQDSKTIPIGDKVFQSIMEEYKGNFPKNSAFFNGCIKISHK